MLRLQKIFKLEVDKNIDPGVEEISESEMDSGAEENKQRELFK